MGRILVLMIAVATVLLSGCGDKLECNKSVSQSVIDDVDQNQLQADLAAIDGYIADQGLTDVMELNNVKYVVTQTGSGGGTPCLENTVVFNYVLRRLDRTIIQQSSSPFSSKLNRLIVGWQIVFPTFTEGTKATLLIPSVYAYGANASDDIPANSSLVFEIELVAIR